MTDDGRLARPSRRAYAVWGVALLAYVPLALMVNAQQGGLVWLWAAYGGFTLARMITLVLRVRSNRWIRVGAL